MSETKFNYYASEFEQIPCNLCGADDVLILALKSANGLRANTCICKNCGLIYINPRMTKESYDNYYKYFYREDRKESKGGLDEGGNLDQNFLNVKKYGLEFSDHLGKFIGGGLVVDVGSSTGGLLAGIKERMPEAKVIGIEPSTEEAEYANKKGINTRVGLIENFVLSGVNEFSGASAIICVRSLNHLLDPKSFFDWSYDNLKAGGHLILSVKDFKEQARRSGNIEGGVQIDHPFMFTPESLKIFVESAGFKVVRLGTDWRKGHHIILVGEKITRANDAVLRLPRLVFIILCMQFWKPYLKAYYLIFNSHRTAFLRKILKGN